MTPLYFGAQWDVPMLEEGAVRVDTPVGEACLYCEEPVRLGEQGLVMPCVLDRDEHGKWRSDLRPIHRECHLRMTLGGVNHLEGRCSCAGGACEPDPPEISRREGARLVSRWMRERGGVA